MPTAKSTVGIFAGAALTAAAFVAPAAAEDTPQPLPANFETVSAENTGKSVTLEFYNVSPASVDEAAKVLNANGCPTTIKSNGFFEGIEASTDGESHIFDDAADAAGWALKRCLS